MGGPAGGGTQVKNKNRRKNPSVNFLPSIQKELTRIDCSQKGNIESDRVGINSGESAVVVWEFPRVIRLSQESSDFPEGRSPEGKSDDPREFPMANFSDNH